ncbi:ABC transporter substrate-binding protein [Antricoccus suffuscus]|uniref:ABC transporter substrate-binding protein n=1 Tax=Antricoccus suffuscus TaxID=1629062 RepID=UPI0014740FF1|nr:ABC transporter substrate-binding protein [Antricoccus suffuscus]
MTTTDRRQFLRMVGIGGATLASIPLLGACGPGSSGDASGASASGKPVKGGTLRVVHLSNFSTLDPHAGISGNDHVYLYPMFDTLVDFDPKTLEPKPGLLSSWEYTSPTTLVLKLQKGVKFHDGVSLDADAVKYNLDRALTLPKSSVAVDLASIDNVQVVADDQVQLNLKQPDTALPLILSDRAGMMVSPKAAAAGSAQFSLAPVGTGPYKFKSAVSGETVEVERFDGYWQPDTAHLDGIKFSIITDPQAAANAMQSGQVDFMIDVDFPDVQKMKNVDGVQVIKSPSLAFQRTPLRMGREPFSDVRLRKAMNYAIDRDGINAAVLQGLGSASYAEVPPEHWAFPKSITPTFKHNVKKAKSLLKEAGYSSGLSIEGIVSTGVPQQIAVAMQSQVAEAGIDMKVTVVDHTQANEMFREKDIGEAFFSGWSGRPDPYQTYAAHYLSASAYVTTYEEPPELQAAFAKTLSSSKIADRKKAFLDLATIGRDNALDLTTVYVPQIAAKSAKVGGYVPNLYGKPKLSQMWLSS